MSVFEGLAGAFTGAFGQTVKVYPANGVARDIQAIFRRKSEDDALGDYGAVVSETYISAASEDVADITEGDTVVVGDETFRTQAPMKDGRAMTKIPLLST